MLFQFISKYKMRINSKFLNRHLATEDKMVAKYFFVEVAKETEIIMSTTVKILDDI